LVRHRAADQIINNEVFVPRFDAKFGFSTVRLALNHPASDVKCIVCFVCHSCVSSFLWCRSFITGRLELGHLYRTSSFLLTEIGVEVPVLMFTTTIVS